MGEPKTQVFGFAFILKQGGLLSSMVVWVTPGGSSLVSGFWLKLSLTDRFMSPFQSQGCILT
jgi:hypothetical protein